jgi:hypothetical protein
LRKWCWLFFDGEGEIRNEFLLCGPTVNKECYVRLMKRLRDPARRKGSLTWRGKWSLHHDSAAAYSTLVIPDVNMRRRLLPSLRIRHTY